MPCRGGREGSKIQPTVSEGERNERDGETGCVSETEIRNGVGGVVDEGGQNAGSSRDKGEQALVRPLKSLACRVSLPGLAGRA